MLIATAAPSGAVTTSAASPSASVVLIPIAEVDLDAFAARAVAWSAARRAHRAASQQRALTAAADGRAAEAERIAEAEAVRIAEDEARAEAERLAAIAATSTTVAPTTVPTTTVAPDTTSEGLGPPVEDPATTTVPAGDPGTPTAAQWQSLRQCESGDNYSAVSRSGRYRGAYQFSQGTWDWVAAFGDPSLIGVDPAVASPDQQDALALALWQVRGWSPWPGCGAGL